MCKLYGLWGPAGACKPGIIYKSGVLYEPDGVHKTSCAHHLVSAWCGLLLPDQNWYLTICLELASVQNWHVSRIDVSKNKI